MRTYYIHIISLSIKVLYIHYYDTYLSLSLYIYIYLYLSIYLYLYLSLYIYIYIYRHTYRYTLYSPIESISLILHEQILSVTSQTRFDHARRPASGVLSLVRSPVWMDTRGASSSRVVKHDPI